MGEFVVYKPKPNRKAALAGRSDAPLAVRPDTLDGKMVGLLFNSKVNADVYLQRVRELLQARYPAASFVQGSKATATKPMEPDVFEAMRRCDVVVNAFGD